MTDNPAWHEDDLIWADLEEWIFGEERWAAAINEVDQILGLLQLKTGADILDLGCGPGRHSINLARRGNKVTGVDRTQKFLDKARKIASHENLEIDYIKADMRSFCREDSFDAIINLSTAIGYFEPEEEMRVIGNIYKSLRDGGKLIIEFLGKEYIVRTFQARGWIERDGHFLLEEHIPNEDWSYLNYNWILIKNGISRRIETRLRLYSAYELKSLLKGAGFIDIRCYGNFSGSDYDHEASRLVVVAVK